MHMRKFGKHEPSKITVKYLMMNMLYPDTYYILGPEIFTTIKDPCAELLLI